MAALSSTKRLKRGVQNKSSFQFQILSDTNPWAPLPPYTLISHMHTHAPAHIQTELLPQLSSHCGYNFRKNLYPVPLYYAMEQLAIRHPEQHITPQV